MKKNCHKKLHIGAPQEKNWCLIVYCENSKDCHKSLNRQNNYMKKFRCHKPNCCKRKYFLRNIAPNYGRLTSSSTSSWLAMVHTKFVTH
jgi:hypothetical protein